MKIGVVFPQTEFESNPITIRDYAQTAEDLGYSHILIYDHILGANPDRPDKLIGPYTYKDPFLAPLLLYSYMAAITEVIEFTTGILILPQRQTALVAKQTATLDILSGGRLRLGIGLGWNQVEYHSLDQDFLTRGRRIEEQVKLLRLLWSQSLVTFEGNWDRIPDAGINPLPVQQPIPIWFGGHHENVLRRVAELGDGWMPNMPKAADARPLLDKISIHLEKAGRSWSEIGLEPRLWYGHNNPDKWFKNIEEWRSVGATHISLNTMGFGLATPEEHIAAITEFASAVGVGR